MPLSAMCQARTLSNRRNFPRIGRGPRFAKPAGQFDFKLVEDWLEAAFILISLPEHLSKLGDRKVEHCADAARGLHVVENLEGGFHLFQGPGQIQRRFGSQKGHANRLVINRQVGTKRFLLRRSLQTGPFWIDWSTGELKSAQCELPIAVPGPLGYASGARTLVGKSRIYRVFLETGMPNPDNNGADKPETTKTVTLTEKDLRDAARLFRLISDPSSPTGGLSQLFPESAGAGAGTDREILISRAQIIVNNRRQRERYFDRQLFGEPAWDILLLLYVSEISSARLTTTRLADLIDTPQTTVGRWLNHLEDAKLIERQPHPTDRRTVFINLLKKGRAALDSYLSSIPG